MTTDKRELWNRCDDCGKIIPYADFDSGAACRNLATVDSAFSSESYRTVCKRCRKTDTEARS